MAKIIIAGGTGLIGQRIEKLLTQKNHDVFILTRNPKRTNHIAWDLQQKTIDSTKINGTEYLINLCGENIGNGRWSKKRKALLCSSRIGTNSFLYEKFYSQESLKQFITASGINCYPLIPETNKIEKDAFGNDYLSTLVHDWEKSADLFSMNIPVCKIRISMVLDKKDGAMHKLIPLVKWGVLSPLGSGKQWMNWVHVEDVAQSFIFALEKNLEGAFNLSGKPKRNSEFTKALLGSHGRKLLMPNVPSFLLKLIFGEQSSLLLNGAFCDNALLKSAGFEFRFENLDDALTDLFPKKL